MFLDACLDCFNFEDFLVSFFFINAGPKPGPPRNVTVSEISNGFLVSWQPPLERADLVQYYAIRYKSDGPYKTLNKGQIRPEETQYLGNYYFLGGNMTGSNVGYV